MKYYAVTNDPAELMHYGIKGMKWGVIRTDAQLGHPSKPKKPRSAAYKKAESKLGKMMKSGIKKAEAHWQEHNSPENKAYRAYKKAEKRFEKHLQKAREGRLRYKGISDAEIGRITDRLMLERQSRSLSGAEKPKFMRRVGEAVGEGVLRGTTSYIDARMRGRGQTTAEIKRAKRMARFESNGAYQRRVAKNEARQEYYREQAEAGEPMTRAGTLVRMGLKNAYYNARESAAEQDHDSAEVERIRSERSLYNRQTGMNLLGSGGRAAVVRQRRAESREAERKRKLEDLINNQYYTQYAKDRARGDYERNHPGTGLAPMGLPAGVAVKKPKKTKQPSTNNPVVTPHSGPKRPTRERRSGWYDATGHFHSGRRPERSRGR